MVPGCRPASTRAPCPITPPRSSRVPRACTASASASPTSSGGSRSTSERPTISRSRASPDRSPGCAMSCPRWRASTHPIRWAVHSVLVVDDDPLVRLSLVGLHPFADDFDFAAEAGNGAEALAVLAAHPEIGIVLLDLSMPVMDGLEVLRRLRADPPAHPPAVVVLSAHGDYHLVRGAFKLGAI